MNPQIPKDLKETIERAGIIAVLVVDDPAHAVPLAKTLMDNGITAMELTLRTETALTSLKNIRKELPGMLAGVGTLLKPEQVPQALGSGAAFAVAPGFNPRVVVKAAEAGLPFAPGISTPSELEGAIEKDCNVFKFFHAERMGGPAYLKAINGPYAFLDLKYIPLGGLTADNMKGYLELPEVLALGGSWIAPRDLIQAEDWSAIGKNAAEAVRKYEEVRG